MSDEPSPDTEGTRYPRARRGLTVVLAVALLVSVGAVVWLAVNPPETTDPYTEFYVLGPERNASGYPETLAPGESASIIVGVSNHEHRAMTYRMAVAWNDSVTHTREWRVPDGDTVERSVTVTAPAEPDRYRLRLLLYRNGTADEPYRTLRLWVTVRDPAGSDATPTTRDVTPPP